MAEQTKTRARKPRATPAKAKPDAKKQQESSQQSPVVDQATLQAALAWLNVVDNWTIAGHQNMLPRWVYVIIGLLLLT